MAKIKSDYNWDGTQNYDWLDAITRTGYYQDYNISFSGGNGKTRYYASLGYLNQEGVAINSDMKRYSARFNLETSYKWFNFGFNTSLLWQIWMHSLNLPEDLIRTRLSVLH